MLTLALAAALAVAAPPKPTVAPVPGQHYVTVPVKIRGKNWPVGTSCTNRVKVTLKLPGGKTKLLGPARLTARGRFTVTWTPPRFTTGLVRMVATETCKGRPLLVARTGFRVLPTP